MIIMKDKDKNPGKDEEKDKTVQEKNKKPKKSVEDEAVAGKDQKPEESVEDEAEKVKKPKSEKPSSDGVDSGEEAVETNEELEKRIIKEHREREARVKERKPRRVEEEKKVEWKPRTKLGWQVFRGEIASMRQIMEQSNPIKEVELVDKLLPELQEEILDVGRVQRVTDSGRRMRFRVVAAVGNNDGYVGIGVSKGKEAGPTIRKAIERAKLNIVEVKRGCGSWECGCGQPHTVPFKVSGKEGSVNVTLKPAPRGTGIVTGELSKTLIHLAGIQDVWVKTEGHSRTGINFAKAVIQALQNTKYVKLREGDTKRLRIIEGQCKQPKKEEKPEEETK